MPSAASGRLHGLQMWLNLPAAKKMTEPRYQELLSDQLPLEKMASGGVIKVIAGSTDKGTTSPISEIATKPLFLDLNLNAGEAFTQHIGQEYQAILFVISGAVHVGNELVPEKVLAGLSSGDVLNLKAEQASRCLLIAAEKLHEPIFRHGPFVMNTQEEVMRALDDFRSGIF